MGLERHKEERLSALTALRTFSLFVVCLFLSFKGLIQLLELYVRNNTLKKSNIESIHSHIHAYTLDSYSYSNTHTHICREHWVSAVVCYCNVCILYHTECWNACWLYIYTSDVLECVNASEREQKRKESIKSMLNNFVDSCILVQCQISNG